MYEKPVPGLLTHRSFPQVFNVWKIYKIHYKTKPLEKIKNTHFPLMPNYFDDRGKKTKKKNLQAMGYPFLPAHAAARVFPSCEKRIQKQPISPPRSENRCLFGMRQAWLFRQELGLQSYKYQLINT